ncbi:MAG: hypothetical protein FWF21_02000 [Micrococcales bacterium]|nr:hypothetical protein [Micrococcales bacterium]
MLALSRHDPSTTIRVVLFVNLDPPAIQRPDHQPLAGVVRQVVEPHRLGQHSPDRAEPRPRTLTTGSRTLNDSLGLGNLTGNLGLLGLQLINRQGISQVRIDQPIPLLRQRRQSAFSLSR